MDGAYAFRYLCKSFSCGKEGKNGTGRTKDVVSTCKLWEFVPHQNSQLGLLQTLIVQHDYDRARSLLDQLGDCNESFRSSSAADNDNFRISTPITKSFLSLRQLQHILSKPLSNEENVFEAKECLKRISKSVILSGGDGTEVQCMCDAANFILSWPKNQIRQYSHDGVVGAMVSVQEVCMALSTMSSAIGSVVNVVGSSKSALLEDHRRKLDERTATLKTLLSIVPSLEASKVTVDDPYLAVETTVGLLHALVSQGAFKLVKRLKNSDHGKLALSKHPDVIALSALRIPKSVHPCKFIPWLCEDVLPSLSTGHALLGQIRSFTCRLADHYDEMNVGGGLDSSILLLSVREDYSLVCVHESVCHVKF
jgi:hypothetical protein